MYDEDYKIDYLRENWVLGIIVAIILGLLILAIASYYHQLTAPCSEFATWRTESVPVRCLKDFVK